jgi:hypothetical protein
VTGEAEKGKEEVRASVGRKEDEKKGVEEEKEREKKPVLL